MHEQTINHLIASIKISPTHPLFLSRVFALVSKYLQQSRTKKLDSIQQVLVEEYEEISRRLDRAQIQESTSVRNILRTRQLAQLLIDDKGEILIHLLPATIQFLKTNLYSLGPSRQYDTRRQEHILAALNTLQMNKQVQLLLKKVSKPLSNKYAEDLIRETLRLPPNTVITDAHAKQAVLSAWLCYLRQNVGSCFATAPAVVVQGEQPELFIQDIIDLLSMGRLKRTFAGIEYAVPLSASWGNGDLKKPLLMQLLTKGFTPEIWYSPGLMLAFEAVGLLRAEDSFKIKSEQIKKWIEPLLQQRSMYQPYLVITAEEILRSILLQSAGLKEQDLRDYENRPRGGMIQSQLLIQTPKSIKTLGGIGERCAHFLYQFEIAKNAFKSLTDNPILKSWEFTLASFSETKLEFTRWNLYASLGLGTNEAGGIGQCIHHIIQHKLDIANKKAQEIQYEYEMVYTQVKTLESRIRHASTEKEVQWIKVEYQSRANELYFLQEERDEAQFQARSLVNLYDTLYKLYLELFQNYFQEVYDADVQEVDTGPFDDSPAGFRLLYKHGRSNTSQWTRIKNSGEFVDALASFFVATEPQIADALKGEAVERDLAEVVTAIVNHVKTTEFLETAFHRMAIAHKVQPIKDPLHHLDQVEKKPWVYTSGGTMNTLVSCYYRLEQKPTEVAKWVENEMELLVFLADTLKHIPPKTLEPYIQGQRTNMLMQSPTHAFLLKPTAPLFKEAWMNEDFTYTFVRDHLVKPAEQFIETLLLNEEMIQFLVTQLVEKVSINHQPRFKAVFAHVRGPLTSFFFREYLIETMLQDRGLNYRGRPILSEDEIDSFLYSQLPLFSIYELKDRLHQLLILLPGVNTHLVEEILNIFDKLPVTGSPQIVNARQLQEICKALLCLVNLTTSTPYDYHLHISQAAQKLGFAMPPPIIFADTNWVKEDFGFVVNPGTGKLGLWRLDYLGSVGYPMTIWKQWLDGSRPDLKWGVYIKPPEYGQN